MGRISVSGGRVFEPVSLVVLVNGARNRDLEIIGIHRRFGVNGDVAVIGVPTWYMEEHLSVLDDATLVIKAPASGKRDGGVYFRGVIDIDSRSESGSNKGIYIRANSTLKMLSGVYVGENEELSIVEYPRRDALGRETGWTLSKILKDLFSDAAMPAEWRSIIKLGAIEAVERTESDVEMPDIKFTSDSYRAALRYLLNLAGRVGISERFTDDVTYLDFYVQGDSDGSVQSLQLPTDSLGPEEGALVLSATRTKDTSVVRGIVRGWGRNKEIMLTVGTDANGESGVGEGLEPAWENATGYDFEAAVVLTEQESAVLSNPECCQAGSPVFREDCLDVFRRFRLPESIRRQYIEKKNLLSIFVGDEEKERKLDLQVFQQLVDYTYDGSNNLDWQGAISSTDFELIPGVKIDEDGYVLFPRPLIGVWQYRTNAATNSPEHVYTRLQGYLTLSLLMRGKSVGYQTRSGGSREVQGVKPKFTFKNENLVYQVLGTQENELLDGDGVGHTYDCIWFDPESGFWRRMETAGTPELIDSDFDRLAGICEASRDEVSRQAMMVVVDLPGLWNSFRVGGLFRVRGRGFDQEVYQVSQVLLDVDFGFTQLIGQEGKPRFVTNQASKLSGGDDGPMVGANEAGRQSSWDRKVANWNYKGGEEGNEDGTGGWGNADLTSPLRNDRHHYDDEGVGFQGPGGDQFVGPLEEGQEERPHTPAGRGFVGPLEEGISREQAPGMDHMKGHPDASHRDSLSGFGFYTPYEPMEPGDMQGPYSDSQEDGFEKGHVPEGASGWDRVRNNDLMGNVAENRAEREDYQNWKAKGGVTNDASAAQAEAERAAQERSAVLAERAHRGTERMRAQQADLSTALGSNHNGVDYFAASGGRRSSESIYGN